MSDIDITEDYPNEGSTYAEYYDVPKERREAELAEAAPIAGSYPIMGEVAEWFQDQIQACDNLDNLDFNEPPDMAAQVLAYKLLKQLLIDKSHDWRRFLEDKA